MKRKAIKILILVIFLITINLMNWTMLSYGYINPDTYKALPQSSSLTNTENETQTIGPIKSTGKYEFLLFSF